MGEAWRYSLIGGRCLPRGEGEDDGVVVGGPKADEREDGIGEVVERVEELLGHRKDMLRP